MEGAHELGGPHHWRDLDAWSEVSLGCGFPLPGFASIHGDH